MGKCGGAVDGCGGTCTGSCPSGTICDDQTCQACDVCASGCEYTTVQAAIAAAGPGGVVRVCAGTYTIPGSVDLKIEKNLTIIGAGSGGGGVIIAGDGSSRPASVPVASGAVELRDLAVTGGEGVGGGGIAIFGGATLTLTRVLVADNYGRYGGGIDTFGTVTLNAGTLLTRNSSSSGGGIYNKGSASIPAAASRITRTATGSARMPGVDVRGRANAGTRRGRSVHSITRVFSKERRARSTTPGDTALWPARRWNAAAA